jgi:hypothetical protein
MWISYYAQRNIDVLWERVKVTLCSRKETTGEKPA